jgi:hypothetical protein
MPQKIFAVALFALLAGNIQAQNVGIGTTTPNQKLDIDKGRLRFTGNPSPGISQGIEFTDPAGTTLNGFVGVYNDSTTGLYGFLGSGWSFLHNNKNGNIGLQGNTNPRVPLSFSNSVGNKISVYDNGDGTHYGIGLQAAKLQFFVPSASQDMVFGTGSSSSFTENMRIKGTGMVGIGTATPDKPLTVKVSGMGVSQESADGSAKVGFFTHTNAAYVQTHNNVNLNFSTNNAAAQMTLQAGTGNFGIGQTNPSAKLDVAGTVKIADGTEGAGKVLTSNASGVASWQNSAYGNTERFLFNLYMYDGQPGMVFTGYNLGTANTSYTAPNPFFSVSVGSTGLYHFDANCYVKMSGNFSQTGDGKTIDFQVKNSSISLFPTTFCPFFFYASDNTSRASGNMSFDVYLTSGTSLQFSMSQFLVSGYEKRITVSGHKIAD